MNRTRLGTIAALALAASALACRGDEGTSRPKPPTAGDEAAVHGLPALPSLEPMAQPVRQQIRAQYERLESSRQSGSDANRAAEFGRMGELLMAAESAPSAEPFLEQAMSLDPDNPRWSYFLAHLQRMKGNAEDAAQYFMRTLTRRPDDVPSLVWLANLHLDRGRPDLAVPLFERALRQQPGLFQGLFGLGRAALASGEYDTAIARFEAALAAEPRATAVNYPLAMAYRQAGRLDAAEARLHERGDAQPPLPDPLMRELAEILESPVVYEARGDRALRRGDLSSAVEAFRRAAALAPDRRAIRQKLGTALALTGDVSEAIAIYQGLLDEDPNFAEAHYSLGALLLGNGQPSLAIERFAAAVRADPTYVQARLQLAHTLRQVRAFDQALAAYQGALAVDPRLAEARLGYAITLADAGRYGTARAWLSEGRRSHPDRLEFVELLVRLLAAAPDVNVRDGAMAVELGEQLVKRSRSWKALEAFAMALAETGRWPDAVARQREAISAAQEGAQRDTLTANLQRYERQQPSRLPWVVDPI